MINLFFSDAYLFAVIGLFFDAYLFCDFVALCCVFVSVMLIICIRLLGFLFITMTGYVFLLMLFCLSVSLLLCLFAVTDFVSCFGTAFTELFRPTRPLGRNKLLVICDFKSVVGNDFLLRYYI